jgi:effector-binding domain-containing protein
MSPLPHPYDAAEPASSPRITEAPEIPTAVVVQHDFPMYDMPSLMDGTFAHLAKALAERGIHPVGPAFSLHHRAPVATADREVGIPVDTPLTEPFELPSGYEVIGSTIPGGRIGWVSHVGGYGGLAEKWGAFTEEIGEAKEQMTYPFWEFYVTEPHPDMNPASLRTDLFSLLEPRD